MGRYELTRLIGSGAMGEIWEALDQQLRRRVAIKLMSPNLMTSSAALARFDREARAIAQIQNRHVVQIFDYGIDSRSPYIVMELLQGEDLEARLERVKRLPLATLGPIVAKAAAGLGAAHAKGIVHRDFKPANVFLAVHDGEEAVKVLDFGVVSLLVAEDDPCESPAAGENMAGTPLYMSPEQIRGGPIDHRSDLWSLGVLAYRALVGEFPFSGQSLGRLMVCICTDPFLPPSTVAPELSPEVDRFFERALAKDPDQRFASTKELASAFVALSDGGQRGPAKILVVDDEPDIEILVRQRFRRQIKSSHYQFVFAGNGQQALDRLREHRDIDVILTDINMPVMDGLTFLLRVGDVSPVARVIIVSSYGDMNNIRTAMNRGAFDFLIKPIDFKDLEVTIEKTIKHVSDLHSNIRASQENSVLRMFVSPSLVDRLRARPTADAPEAWTGSVVIIDVAGLHARSATQSPAERVHSLNANFEVIVPTVTNHGGVVDKFLGGAAMAVFRGDDHVARALEASLKIRMQLRSLALRAGTDSPFAVGVAIGVATGEMLSGEIGSKAFRRLDYTILGKVPRLAATLQTAAGQDRILIDARTAEVTRRSFAHVACPDVLAEGGAFELLGRASVESTGLGPIDTAETLMNPNDPHESITSLFVKPDELVEELASSADRAPITPPRRGAP